MHNFDPGLVSNVLRSWLRERLPDADDLVLPPARSPGAGGSSVTLFLTPIIRRGVYERQEQWVLRIQSADHHIYQHPSVERQYRILCSLWAHGAVPVPQPLWYEEDAAIVGAPFFIMKRVDGRIPPNRWFDQGIFAEVGASEREAMWLSAVESLARIHSTNPADFGFLWHSSIYASGLEAEIAAWDSYMHWIGGPMHPVQERARVWLADHPPAEFPTGLAWGDARPANIMFRERHCVAVLDWETASLGGAETDLGWWLYNDWMASQGYGVPRLPGIGGRVEFISAWEHFAGRRARDIEWHEMFATWRFSLIYDRAMRIRLNPGAIGSLPVRNLPYERLAQLIAGT